MKPPAQPNQSLIDGLSCLGAIAANPSPMGVRELARQLGLETTRVNRLLKTLAHLGLAHQNAEKKYHVGPGIHVLAAQSLFGSGLLRRAAQPLNQLGETGLIVALGVLWRDQVCYLYHAAPGMNSIEAVGRAGLYPAARSAIGLALLAQFNQTEIRRLYSSKINDTPGHPLTLAELFAQLKQTREQGYAQVVQPSGHLSLGMVIPQTHEPAYAAIALSGPIKTQHIRPLVTRLISAAQTIAFNDAIESSRTHPPTTKAK